MNEIFFFGHLLFVLFCMWPFLRFGRDGLISWCVLQPILANLFVLKQIELFGFTVTCSDVYAVSTALGLNLLQEYYGKEAAKRCVWLCFTMLLFFVAMSLAHLIYQASPYDSTQSAYSTILTSTPRLVAASIISFFCVQWLDVQLFGFLKRRCANLPLFTRNCISLSFSQLIDTALFTILGLYGQMQMLFDVFIVSFVIKLSIALALSLSTLKRPTHVAVSL